MANTAIDWALQQAVNATMKIVLFVLANRADAEEWKCFPSLTTICRETSLGRSSVARSLTALERLGLVRRIQRAYQSTIYVLTGNQAHTGTGPTLALVPQIDQSHCGTRVVPQ